MCLLADRGFNIADECAARNVFLSVPPGKCGATQFTPKDVRNTSDIARVRILVEQVIRRMTTFRIIGNELSLSLIPHINDILIVCSALSNIAFKPILMH